MKYIVIAILFVAYGCGGSESNKSPEDNTQGQKNSFSELKAI